MNPTNIPIKAVSNVVHGRDEDQQAITDTQVIYSQHYQYRQRGLAFATPIRWRQSKAQHQTPNKEILPIHPAVWDTKMDEATQPATQPYYDPRRLGRNNSEVSDQDASDIICILHPLSIAAHEAVAATVRTAPEHILPNEDLLDANVEDDQFHEDPQARSPTRDIALRFSSITKDPSSGFTFGRNAGRCDVLLVKDENEKCVSNIHFRIFLNNIGILMLQDTSTNGTVVDENHLQSKVKGRPANKPATQMIQNGSIIFVVGRNKEEIKFLVRNPKRGDHLKAYEHKLRKYLQAQGKPQGILASGTAEHTFGMHWNGGSTYNVTGHLGKGAFATVYKVATKKDGLLFAAKELDKRRFLKNGILDLKFDNEIKIMKGLRHPNIVQYEDYHDYDQWVYIIMEYVPGGELSTMMQKQGAISEQMAKLITRQILHALDYLHRRGITHRDIKPDNILISNYDPFLVKLSDFGLSKCVNDQETFLKTFCGTLLYCAPEVYPDYDTYSRGLTRKRRRLGEPAPKTSPYNQAVDIWSYGAVLFHMLCNRAPIIGRGDDKGAQMLSNIMTKKVDFGPLRQLSVTEEAIDFIGRLLNRNPLMRPKEAECFQHPWIAKVEDLCEYSEEDEEDAAMFEQNLQRVEEEEEEEGNYLDDEDDQTYDAIFGAQGITGAPYAAAEIDRMDPRYQSKRPRLDSGTPEDHDSVSSMDVVYPVLPYSSDSSTNQPPNTGGGRLFGEITASELRSSGVFGQPAPLAMEVPAIQNRIEQISVNDFVTDDNHNQPRFSNEPQQNPQQRLQAIPITGPAGSALSLLGAEAQIGQLNMASPDGGASEGTSPDTGNPVTPNTREITPPSLGVSEDDESTKQVAPPPPDVTFSRFIDLELLGNNAEYQAVLQAREESRVRTLGARADTFNGNRADATEQDLAQLAKTMDAGTGGEVTSLKKSAFTAEHGTSGRNNQQKNILESGTTTNLPESALFHTSKPTMEDGFRKPNPRLGKLTTLPGSFVDLTIYLENRLTSWGRGIDCNIKYADKMETRIPQYALQVTFHAPEMEKHIERGEDWMLVPEIYTVVSTKARQCIWVNGVELRKETREGDGLLYGKIYTGDIITIFTTRNKPFGPFLKFKVEIGYGDSARTRPPNEPGFEIRKETVYHQRVMRERESMRMMSSSNKENCGSGADGI